MSYALCHGALYLSPDTCGVNDPPYFLDNDIAYDAHVSGDRVHLNFGEMNVVCRRRETGKQHAAGTTGIVWDGLGCITSVCG